jgi:NAD(P) transhydrogenase subunit alpha
MDAVRTILIPRERGRETRVAIVPTVVPTLAEAGWTVLVERGAGDAAGYPDGEYVAHGARIYEGDRLEPHVVAGVRIGPASEDPLALERRLAPGTIVLGIADPQSDPSAIREVADGGLTLYALDRMPRISRAQAMDVLSSQSTVTGYKAAILAANELPKMFPMLTTAAGTIPPAEVFVIGAGVAGLTAIATARRLGAVVQGYDVRPAARDEIESLGARAIVLPLDPEDPREVEDAGGYARELGPAFERRQRAMLTRIVSAVDVVITAAAIPGRRAPLLLDRDAVDAMRPGSLIVDLAAPGGGNCQLTRPDGTVVTDRGVRILGPTNLPATIPREASQMFAKNVASFVTSVLRDPAAGPDLADPIVRACLVTYDGEVLHPTLGGSEHGSATEEEEAPCPA